MIALLYKFVFGVSLLVSSCQLSTGPAHVSGDDSTFSWGDYSEIVEYAKTVNNNRLGWDFRLYFGRISKDELQEIEPKNLFGYDDPRRKAIYEWLGREYGNQEFKASVLIEKVSQSGGYILFFGRSQKSFIQFLIKDPQKLPVKSNGSLENDNFLKLLVLEKSNLGHLPIVEKIILESEIYSKKKILYSDFEGAHLPHYFITVNWDQKEKPRIFGVYGLPSTFRQRAMFERLDPSKAESKRDLDKFGQIEELAIAIERIEKSLKLQ